MIVIEIARILAVSTVKENELTGGESFAPLKIVDGRAPGWEKKALAEADTKRNFIVVLKRPEDLQPLCASLECTHQIPEKLERWGLHALADALAVADYSFLLALYQQFDLRLIEQLRLKRTRPPRTKRFILYCEIRGIVSEHETLEEAGAALLVHIGELKRRNTFPLVSLYSFRDGEWIRHHRAL